MEELPLGGNWSDARRVGDTVHRRAGAWTPAVHALLTHLRHVGFVAAPVPLGMDERGRAVLTFIEGDAHLGWPEPIPAWVYEDQITLVGAAQLLREYHDAAATFVAPADARWRFVAPAGHEVICHLDWAPYNAVFAGHRPIAMLDWDSAGPAPRLWDLAYSADTWVPLDHHAAEMPLSTRATRLRAFCAAYGDVAPRDVLVTLVDLLPFLADVIQDEADAGDPGSKRLVGFAAPRRARENAARLREQMESLLG